MKRPFGKVPKKVFKKFPEPRLIITSKDAELQK
jgi:hypothetical protein